MSPSHGSSVVAKMAGEPVTLAIYDLSQGMARQLSPMLIGKQLDGIWHTALRVFGHEYYFGGGICRDVIGHTPYGQPTSTQVLGHTTVTAPEFMRFLQTEQSTRFFMASYHLLDNNCNHFTDTCSMFLMRVNIPRYILDLPAQALNSPIGPMLRSFIEPVQASIIQQSISQRVHFDSLADPPAAAPSSAAASTSSTTPRSATYEPIALSKADVAAIRRKLAQLSPDLPADLSSPTALHAHLSAVLSPPSPDVFPSLDLLRLAVLRNDVVTDVLPALPRLIYMYIATPETKHLRACRLMTLRLCANVLFTTDGASAFVANEVLPASVAVALATILGKRNDPDDADEAAAAMMLDLPVVKTACVLARNMCTAPARVANSPAHSSTDEYSTSVWHSVLCSLTHFTNTVVTYAPPLPSRDTSVLLTALALALQAMNALCEHYDSARDALHEIMFDRSRTSRIQSFLATAATADGGSGDGTDALEAFQGLSLPPPEQ